METESQVDTRRMDEFGFVLISLITVIYSSHRNEKEFPHEDLRAQFYELYRKEAEEYDKEFMKRYDEDLNTTLIFVGYTHCLNARVLTWVSGRSVLRCHLCLHHPGPSSAPVRLN